MILLTGNDEGERARLATILREARVELVLPKDVVEARSAVRDKPIKLALLCAQAYDEPLLAVVKALDEARSARSVTLVLVGDELPDDFLVKAVRAGIDGEMRRRKSKEVVLAQVEARGRLARRPASERLITEAGAVAAKPAGSALELVTAASSWQGARDLLRDAAAAFLTVPARVGPAPSSDGALAAGCQILMGNAADSVELRLALGADTKSIKQLATHLFGEEGEDMGNELLSELSNILMGALKTSFSSEEIKFAAGLPEPVPAARVLQPATNYGLQATFQLQLADARIVVYVGVRSSAVTSVTVTSLREGMVVAGDIFNPKGLMLVRSGTRLSLNMVEKLRGILTPKQQIEVLST